MHSRLFKRMMLVIYWIALPLAILSAVGSTLMQPTANKVPQWLSVVGFTAFSGLVSWRLWLNSRALGYRGPSPTRVFLIIAPLGLLGIAGLVVALLGLSWIGIGLWLTLGHEAIAPPGAWPLGTAIAGLIAVILGLLLTLPVVRSIRRTSRPLPNKDKGPGIAED